MFGNIREILIAGLALFILAACSSQSGLPATVVATATSQIAATLTPRFTPTPLVTRKPLPTITSSPTPSQEPPLTLNTREPSIQQINDYMRGLFPDVFYFSEEDYTTHVTPFESQKFLTEDVSGDGKSDLVAYDEITSPPAVGFAIVYQDVNGDAEADFIFYGYHGLVVLLWDGAQYAKPFQISSGWSRGGGPWIYAAFRDWTNDGVPEIVLDEESAGGGSDLWISYANRSIIHCAKACKTAWSDTYSIYTDDSSTGGIARYEVDMRLISETPLILRVVDKGFAIYCCSEGGGLGEPQSLSIYPSKLKLYTWKGDGFELTNEETINIAQIIDSQSILSATSSSGVEAQITWQDNGSHSNSNEFCQLLINDSPIGRYFGCRHKFTTVDWKDLTNDGQEDLVVATYSAAYPYGPSLPYSAYGDEVLSSETCPHQKLLAYQWDGETVVEIANVSGCVIHDDLYGVRLEDYDGDGQIEILAAPIHLQDTPYYANNRAYKWNGKIFVMWSEVPLK